MYGETTVGVCAGKWYNAPTDPRVFPVRPMEYAYVLTPFPGRGKQTFPQPKPDKNRTECHTFPDRPMTFYHCWQRLPDRGLCRFPRPFPDPSPTVPRTFPFHTRTNQWLNYIVLLLPRTRKADKAPTLPWDTFFAPHALVPIFKVSRKVRSFEIFVFLLRRSPMLINNSNYTKCIIGAL